MSTNAGYDILRAQSLNNAVDALLAAHTLRDELAEAFTASSAEFIKMISDQPSFEPDAIQVVKQDRKV